MTLYCSAAGHVYVSSFETLGIVRLLLIYKGTLFDSIEKVTFYARFNKFYFDKLELISNLFMYEMWLDWILHYIIIQYIKQCRELMIEYNHYYKSCLN